MTRENVCKNDCVGEACVSDCAGVVMCVDGTIEEATSIVAPMAPENAITCIGPGYSGTSALDCPDGQVRCLFSKRSGVNDCQEAMPSDFFWSTVCAVAALDAVHSLSCYCLVN